MKAIHAGVFGLVLVSLGGCGNVDSSHLVFGQKISVGLTIDASAPEQSGELSLGYKDRNIAVIPVAVKAENADKYQTLGAYGPESKSEAGTDGSGKLAAGASDAYSTVGQFELATGGNGTASVGLGKFFATGVAAQILAEGFAAKLGKTK